MRRLWEKSNLGKLPLSSHLVCSSAGEGMCDERFHATPRLVERYRELGRDGVIGLIITGHAFVSPEGRMREAQTSIADDSDIAGLSDVSSAARRDGSRIFLQISHGGACCQESLTGLLPLGPSKIDHSPEYAGRGMSLSEVQALPQLFADAARRAQLAGFDGVQLHMGHGFLLNEFLSPLFNHREDEYGGTQERRTRLAVEIIKAIHELCGADYPVIAKINYADGVEGGLTMEESLASATLMEAAGLSGIEVSGGMCFQKDARLSPMKPVSLHSGRGLCYFRDAAACFHRALSIPVIMVGGIRTLEAAEDILIHNDADFVSLCRPLIRDPALARRWRYGTAEPSDCLSCNSCLICSRTSLGIRCPVKKVTASI